MLGDLKRRWRVRRHLARTRRAVADLPDHLLRDIGLAPGDRARQVMRELLRTGP